MSDRTTSNRRPTARLVVAAVMLSLVGVLGLAACAQSSNSAASTQQDHQAMMETVAKWYVAEGAANLDGIKAAVYDPTAILGLATATPPPADQPTTTVVWKWVGEKIVLTVPKSPEEPTVTVVASATPDVVLLSDATGAGGTLYMRKVNGVWKIDVLATQKAAEAADAADAQEGLSEPSEKP